MKDRGTALAGVAQRALASVEDDAAQRLAGQRHSKAPGSNHAVLERERREDGILARLVKRSGLAGAQLAGLGVDLLDLTQQVTHAITVMEAAVHRRSAAGHQAILTPGDRTGHRRPGGPGPRLTGVLVEEGQRSSDELGAIQDPVN